MRRQDRPRAAGWAVIVWVAAIAGMKAQQAPVTPAGLTPVPRVMWFTGVFHPADARPLTPVESITVAVYGDREGGEALWRETQQVALDVEGRYSILLGATLLEGLPLDVFTSGEPRWIGVTVHRSGEKEQPRVHLSSVPYALKAADAGTLGGLPPSAFLRAGDVTSDGRDDRKAAAAGSSSDLVATGTPNSLAKYINSVDLGSSAVFENGGRVGIGTQTPADSLHVSFLNTTGAFTGLAVQNMGSSAASYSGMLFYDQNGALGQFQGFNNQTHEYRINNIASGGRINFMIGSSSKFAVANNGNIGVGVGAPDFKLHIIDASNTGLRVQTETAGGTVASFGGVGDFQIDAPFFPGGRLTVTENSRVGIGTSGPEGMLEIAAGADGDSAGDLRALALAYRFGGFRHWIRTRHNAFLSGTGNAIDIFVNNSAVAEGSSAPGVGSTHVMTLDSGKVGIATMTPDRTLTVNGTADKPGGGSWDTFSDERLKTIKGRFTPGLAAVLQLRPIRYHYKPDNALGLRSVDEHIGFSAQAVQRIIPEAVSTNDKGYLLVNNDPILWTMLNAIQEQQKEIQELRRQLASLEAAVGGRQ